MNSAIKTQLQQQAKTYFESAHQSLSATKEIQTNYQSERKTREKNEMEDAIMRIEQNPVLEQQVKEVTNAARKTAAELELAEPKKITYQEHLKQYDVAMRKAWALGGLADTQKNALLNSTVNKYGLNQSKAFKPNGTWWNLTSSVDLKR